jgi:type I restriction enzyme R subunit
MDEIGLVHVDVLISAPDMREGEEDAFEKVDDKVKKFWSAMMDKYGKADNYEKSIISAFKKQDQPEVIIVVDKLLTGFDAPRNVVLYLTRQLREHTLLQAIARVNRLYPGKDYGYIIDYFGNLGNLDSAINTYSGLGEFDPEELAGAITNMNKEIEKLPQAHSELWDIFKTIKNKYDEPAYEELLFDESMRHLFYEKLSVYARILKLALSSFDFATKTPDVQIDKYKNDAKFFLKLRVSVKRIYNDEADHKEYEQQVQKLIDKHITTEGEILKITELVNIFDKEQRQAEVEKITGKAAKADHIASRTVRAINIKMNEDPAFYKKLSQLIHDTISDYHQLRISEADYLKKATEYEDTFINGRIDNIPHSLKDNASAIAFFNLTNSIFENELKEQKDASQLSAELSKGIDEIIRSMVYDGNILLVDWQNNSDVEGKIKIGLDDFIFDLKSKYELDLSFDKIDELIEECIKVAKLKYT